MTLSELLAEILSKLNSLVNKRIIDIIKVAYKLGDFGAEALLEAVKTVERIVFIKVARNTSEIIDTAAELD